MIIPYCRPDMKALVLNALGYSSEAADRLAIRELRPAHHAPIAASIGREVLVVLNVQAVPR